MPALDGDEWSSLGPGLCIVIQTFAGS